MYSSRVFHASRALMAAAGKSSGTKSATTAKSATTESPKRATSILKTHPVSPALSEFVGAPEISRPEAVKKIWEHIKANNLQNPSDKRKIFCDDKLKAIFEGKETVGFLEISKLLTPHFVKAE